MGKKKKNVKGDAKYEDSSPGGWHQLSVCVVAPYLEFFYGHHCGQDPTPGSPLPVIYDSQVQGFFVTN